MSDFHLDHDFIKQEGTTGSRDLLRLNQRLFAYLPLFLKFLPLTVVSILLASGAPSVFRWYAGHYVSAISEGSFKVGGASAAGMESQFNLETLLWIVVLGTAFRIAAWVFFEATGMWSSQGIYSRMVQGLSRTRTTFFDENPSGRIINRLIRDFDELRTTAIIFAGDFLNATVEILSIGVVAGLASPWAMLMVFPLLLMFFFIQGQRSEMIEHARSLSAVASGQVLNRKNDLIEGREIFILYGKAEHLLERMTQSTRRYLRASLLTVQVDIWATFWIRIFAEVFSLFVLFFVIDALGSHRIDTPVAAVIISALFGITSSIGWLDFASSMVSRSGPHLRRVFEFIDLPAESTEESAHQSLYKSPDPQAGRIKGDLVFDHYSMSYRKDLPLILNQLNLTLPQGSKTALVGRTGSGKTSVIQALLRMVYVQSGDIRIGTQSIYSLDIRELRRLFGVVPQAPYLFEGTLRSNLDRIGTLPEDLLQEALRSVGLGYALDHGITEGGLNLSVGERQLICLARVIASDRPFVLMDEPTSGLDPETDARVTRILHTSLKDKTVLTIAHRKESLKNYDFTLEMSRGRLRTPQT